MPSARSSASSGGVHFPRTDSQAAAPLAIARTVSGKSSPTSRAFMAAWRSAVSSSERDAAGAAAWEEAEASAALTAGALGNLERTNEPQTGHALGPASSSERSHASNT